MNKCLNCNKPVRNKYCNVSCQNKHSAILGYRKNKKYTFEKTCPKCSSLFKVTSTIGKEHKTKKFCSRKCANSRNHSDKIKNKISKSVNEYMCKMMIENICITCNKKFNRLKENKYCSKKCTPKNKKPQLYYNKNKLIIKKTCLLCQKEFNGRKRQKYCSRRCSGRAGGIKSAQTKNTRSKNEITFFELCNKKFNNIIHNTPIFNGWDADIILKDEKIAILWNGKWHYEKISKKHSVKQVQNRDKIKLKEIKKCGYTPYVIKDMGKHNPEFVQEKFNEFLEWIK